EALDFAAALRGAKVIVNVRDVSFATACLTRWVGEWWSGTRDVVNDLRSTDEDSQEDSASNSSNNLEGDHPSSRLDSPIFLASLNYSLLGSGYVAALFLRHGLTFRTLRMVVPEFVSLETLPERPRPAKDPWRLAIEGIGRAVSARASGGRRELVVTIDRWFPLFCCAAVGEGCGGWWEQTAEADRDMTEEEAWEKKRTEVFRAMLERCFEGSAPVHSNPHAASSKISAPFTASAASRTISPPAAILTKVLETTSRHGNIGIVRLILASGRVDRRDPALAEDGPALRVAAAQGHVRIVEELAAWSSRKGGAASGQIMMMMEVCRRGHVEVLEWLMQREKERERRRQELGESSGSLEVGNSKARLPSPSPSHEEDSDDEEDDPPAPIDFSAASNFPLRIAAIEGHLPVVRLLLSHPLVDPSAENHYAFLKACELGYAGIVEAILAAYIDKGHVRKQKEELQKAWLEGLKVASVRGNVDVMETLLQQAAKMSSSLDLDPMADDLLCLREAAAAGQLGAVRLLMRTGMVSRCARGLSKAVAEAISRGYLEIVRELVGPGGGGRREWVWRAEGMDSKNGTGGEETLAIDGGEVTTAAGLVRAETPPPSVVMRAGAWSPTAGRRVPKGPVVMVRSVMRDGRRAEVAMCLDSGAVWTRPAPEE
ncbi:hypothetical protein HDU96_007834, partial [Phlyctochytrium bullatum]